MNGRFHLLGLGCIALLLVAVVTRQKPTQPTATGPEVTVVEAEPVSPKEAQARAVAYEKLTQPHLKELARLEADQKKRDRAAAGMKSHRENLQFKAQAGWTELLTTNAAAFQALRALASRSPDHKTPCTLCNGKGYQYYCLLCQADKGRCVTCKGTGKVFVEECCPTCLGAGKCFLCFGSGHMSCPFCEDGMISADVPLPPATMPVN